MKFTFGIITNGAAEGRVEKIVHSIEELEIPRDCFEIIIVGSTSKWNAESDMNIIPFNSQKNPGHICAKKNIITDHSRFDNIVYLHDYIWFHQDWYKQMIEFGDDWDICMNRILNLDGSRYRDWVFWDHPDYCFLNERKHQIRLCPYEWIDDTKYMYISGAYWIAKKEVMCQCRLNEKLKWGKGEDVEWSGRVLKKKKFKYIMNPNAIVQLMKQKDVVATPIGG